MASVTEPPSSSPAGSQPKQKQIYTYNDPANLPVFSLDWSRRADQPFRLAFSTFEVKAKNHITIVRLNQEKNPEILEPVATVEESFPPTKVMWMPYAGTDKEDLFAATSDSLRIWKLDNNKVIPRCTLTSQTYYPQQTSNSEHHAPLTSFDWNFTDQNIIGTASVDTTCTIWDIHAQRATAQLIAHDKEVFDIAFTQGSNVFTTVGADGSVRLFDLRNLEHSTIIYESPKYSPLLRVKWSHINPNLLATLIMDTESVIILDIRQPSLPLVTLKSHTKPALAVEWSPQMSKAPQMSNYIATGSEDHQAFIWDLQTALPPAGSSTTPKSREPRRQREINEPLLAYDAGYPVNGISWSTLNSDWLALSMEQSIKILKI